MFLAMLFVLLSSCAFGMDKQNQAIKQDSKEPQALEIMANTSPLEYEKLSEIFSEEILDGILPKFVQTVFTPKQWKALDENNVTEQILAYIHKKSDNYYEDQQYQVYNSIPTKYEKQIKNYLKCNRNSYAHLDQKSSNYMKYDERDTPYRAKLITSDIKPRQNRIHAIKQKTNSSQYVGAHIGTFDISDGIYDKEASTVNIESFVDLATNKIAAVTVKITAWNHEAVDNTEKSISFIGTPVAPPTRHKIFLRKAGSAVQNTNLHMLTLLKNRSGLSEVPEKQIKSIREVQQMVEIAGQVNAKKIKNQSFDCTLL